MDRVIDERLSQKLKAVSFLCAMLVVAIHCPLLNKREWISTPEYRASIPAICSALHMVIDVFTRGAVPLFFAISGFLLAVKFHSDCSWYLGMLKKRVISLFVPFVLWNIIYLLVNVVVGRTQLCFDGAGIVEASRLILGWDFNSGVACFQLWFVRNLLVLIVMSPLLVLPLRKPVIGLSVLIVLAFLAAFNVWSPLIPYASVLYFSIGLFCGINHNAWEVWLRRHCRTMWIGTGTMAVALICIGCWVGYDGTRYEIYRTLIIPLSLGVMGVLWFGSDCLQRCLARFRNFFSLSFFIYAAHVLVVSFVSLVFGKCGLTGCSFIWLIGLLKIGLVIALTITLGLAFRRYSRRSFLILTGGRG